MNKNLKEFKVTVVTSGLAGDGFEPIENTTTVFAENEDDALLEITNSEWLKITNVFTCTENGEKKEDKYYDFIAVDKIHAICIREVKNN